MNTDKKNLKFTNLSVDYEEDLLRCLKILDKLPKKKFIEITFDDVINNIDSNDIMDKNKEIKLPKGKVITLEEYIDLIENKKYHHSDLL